MPPLQTPSKSITISSALSLIVLVAVIASVSTYVAVNLLARKSDAAVTQVPASTTIEVPPLASAENAAIIFARYIHATSSDQMMTFAVVPAMSEIVKDGMYRASFFHTQENRIPVSFATTTSRVVGNTAAVELQVCYTDTTCFDADHYWVSLVSENGIWAIAGATSAVEPRE